MDRYKREVGMRAQSSNAVATLQKEIRTKTNEVANLNAKIQKLRKESTDLKSRLEAINKENDAMITEINQLKEWKLKAEVSLKHSILSFTFVSLL
jgi:chromosome segregation ATPase